MTLGGYTLAPGPEWTSAAVLWPLRAVARATDPGHVTVEYMHTERAGEPFQQVHLVCAQGGCDQSVACLIPDATRPGYTLDVAVIQAGVLKHIRQCHESLVTV